MADSFVALLALVLGLLFLAAVFGLIPGLDELRSFSNMRRRYGALGMRIIYLVIALVLLSLSAAVWFDWRLME